MPTFMDRTRARLGSTSEDHDHQPWPAVITGISGVPPPQTREEVIRYLDGLRDRLTGSLPDG